MKKKNVKVRVSIPGNTIVVEKNAKTFEDAIVDCADILKKRLVKVKEKNRRIKFDFYDPGRPFRIGHVYKYP